MKNIVLKIKEYKILIAIVILSAIIRFVRIESAPPSLNWDEISHGYNAYSILKTGRDEWGQLFPFIFRAYGDYKLPIYIYATAISEALFGLTVFAVRLPSVLAGIGSVVFSYLLVEELNDSGEPKKLTENSALTTTYLSLLTAFLMAIEPWSLFLSRGAFEANLAQFFIISGVYFFLRGVCHTGVSLGSTKGDLSTSLKMTKKQILKHLARSVTALQAGVQNDSYSLVISIVLFGLSVWTYNSARVFVPLLLASLVWIFRYELKQVAINYRKLSAYCILIIAIFFVPMFVQLANTEGSARYSKVQILDEGEINKINEGRNNSSLPSLLPKLVHNKVTYFSKEFAANYISHFSPSFLFLNGGDQYQFSIPGRGILYLVNLPFYYIGLAALLWGVLKRNSDSIFSHKGWNIILFWLVLAPIPSSLTREAPHVLRSITFLPIPMILTSYGFTTVISLFKNRLTIDVKKLFVGVYMGVIFISLSGYLNQYFNDYRTNYSWSWQYGYKEAALYVNEHYSDYDKIIVTKKYGEPHEFFLFYSAASSETHNKWDPEKFTKDPNLIRFAQSDWFWIDRFDKYYFVNDWQVDEEGTGNYTFNLESKEMVQCTPKMFKCLLITSPDNSPEGWKLIDSISFLDGQTAFEIYEN